MLRFKNSMKGVLFIENQKTWNFDRTGNCIEDGRDMLVTDMTGALNYPCLSLLSSNGAIDIMLHRPDDTDTRYSTTQKEPFLMNTVMSSGSLIKVVKRSGTENNIKFVQTIFLLKIDTDLDSLINKLGITKVN